MLTAIYPTFPVAKLSATKYNILSADDANPSSIEAAVFSGSPNGGAVLHGYGWDALNTESESDVSIVLERVGCITVNPLAATTTGATLYINIHVKDILGYLGEFNNTTRPSSPAANAVIFNTETGEYQRYESSVWVDKGSNYSEAGVSDDAYSQLKLTIGATGSGSGNNTDPITFDTAKWNSDYSSQTAQNPTYYPPGSTIDLSSYVGNPNGVGTLAVQVSGNASDAASTALSGILQSEVSIDQSTYVATLNKGLNTGQFALEWVII